MGVGLTSCHLLSARVLVLNCCFIIKVLALVILAHCPLVSFDTL